MTYAHYASRLELATGLLRGGVVNESADVKTLLGHTGPVFDLGWVADRDSKGSLLVSASADATARLWRVKDGTSDQEFAPDTSCMMVFPHGGAVLSCCFVDLNTVATGGMDRTLRLWHLPSQKATSWAHLNDAITAVRSTDIPKHRRIAVGLRGGQIFSYTSRSYDRLDFDDLYHSTVRAGAFLEAEKVGTSGVAPATSPRVEPTAFTAQSPPEKSTRSKKWLPFFGSRRAEVVEVSESQIDDTAPDEDLPEEDSPFDNEPVATPDFVRRRITSLAWYRDPAKSDVHDDVKRLTLLAAANSSAVHAYNAAQSNKPPFKVLAGGTRLSLGCGAEPDETGTLAVGSSEDGTLLVWRLDEDGDRAASRSIAQPAIVDCGVSPNAKIQAITVACFVPADPARDALSNGVHDPASQAFLLAADYSGRLIIIRRGEPTSRHNYLPGQALAPTSSDEINPLAEQQHLQQPQDPS